MWFVLRRPFFRDDRNTGRKIFETLPNHRFGSFIRCRYWGPIGLAAQRLGAGLPNRCRRACGNCRHVIDKGGACGNVEDGQGKGSLARAARHRRFGFAALRFSTLRAGLRLPNHMRYDTDG